MALTEFADEPNRQHGDREAAYHAKDKLSARRQTRA